LRALVLAIARHKPIRPVEFRHGQLRLQTAALFVTPAQGVNRRIGDIPRQVDGFCQISLWCSGRNASTSGGPAYRHLPVRGRIIGESGIVKFFGYPANPHGAGPRACCFLYNPKQVAILPAIQVQSGCTGMIVRDVSRPHAQLQGSLRSNADTECPNSRRLRAGSNCSS
jgi:hypothetical protein